MWTNFYVKRERRKFRRAKSRRGVIEVIAERSDINDRSDSREE